jgi:hypothetical protein
MEATPECQGRNDQKPATDAQQCADGSGDESDGEQREEVGGHAR